MTPLPIPMCTNPTTAGCGWRRRGFGDGDLIPTLASAVPWALAGTLASTGPGMVGADTAVVPAGDTALVVATVAAIAAVLVVPRAVVAVASAVGAEGATAVDAADNVRQAPSSHFACHRA